MKIDQLTLRNFRCFDKYEINLSDKFTLLIGDNGSGKTAILDALKIGIADLLFEISDIHASEKRRISISDMRYIEKKLGQESVKEFSKDTFISFDGFFLNSPIHWINGRSSKRFYCLSKNDLDDTETLDELTKSLFSYVDDIKKLSKEFNDSVSTFPVVAYYGTGRLWQKPTPKEKKTTGLGTRVDGYINCLTTSTQFFSWFKRQELISIQKKERRHALEAVRQAIISMIPNSNNVWWDFERDELTFKYSSLDTSKEIPFSMLSDGYRNMIGMVADIAYRMATLNPQLEADVIKQTEGIVLIDEIDLHLHPKWQREVVDRLLKTFPKVQFVASSHSPFIIQSLYNRDDVLLWDLEKAGPVEIESESIEDIAEDQQHVPIPQRTKRYSDMLNAAEAYYQKLHNFKGESNQELLELKSELDKLSIPFSDDPAFVAQLKFERDTLLASKGK
jgi:predicted ATP-binding protein involved in virulence